MFIASKSYRGKVRIRSAWRNFTATLRMTIEELVGVQVSDHVMTETASINWRIYEIFNAGEDVRLWCKGAVHNGTIKYFQYCFLNGIAPVVDANIWVWKNGNGDASTPMLKRYQSMAMMANLNSWTQSGFWSSLLQHFATEIYENIAMVFPHLMPDQIYTGIEDKGLYTHPTIVGQQPVFYRSNIAVERVVFHESGHFSHALKCGVWNYSHIVAAEIKNGIEHDGENYYDGQSPNIAAGKQIALAEGWADFTEYKCLQLFYPNSFEIASNGIENFTMFTSPFNGVRTNFRSWFLSGLFWDINDNLLDNVTGISQLLNGQIVIQDTVLSTIQDNVFIGPSAGLIYNHLTSNVYNNFDLKNSLLSSYPTQAIAIDLLFRTYGLYY